MNSWKIILATIVIFGAGVITGGLLVNHIDHSHPHRPKTTDTQTNSLYTQVSASALRRSNAPPMLEQKRLDFLRKVSAELNLSADQKQHVEAILCESQDRVKKLWECISPQLREEMNATHDKLRAELTADQRQCFEQLLKRPPQRRSEDSTNRPPREARKPAAENQTNGDVPINMLLQQKP